MTIAEALEIAGRELQAAAGIQPIHRTAIIARVEELRECAEGSVIPSDHCYNRTNAGVRSSHIKLFLHMGEEKSGEYHFVGRDYPYSGPVDEFPHGA